MIHVKCQIICRLWTGCSHFFTNKSNNYQLIHISVASAARRNFTKLGLENVVDEIITNNYNNHK